MEVHRVELREDPVAALNLVALAADEWGGLWESHGKRGGRLGLPVLAGLRHGWVAGPVNAEPSAGGTVLTFEVEESRWHLQTASVITLLLAAAGALVTIAAPLVPALWRLVPLGIMLSVGAWLFIVSRLRNSGPEEFFELLAREDGTGTD